MRALRLPSLILSALLQFLPFVRVVTVEAVSGTSPILAILRLFAGSTAVAGSFHAVSGASITLTNPAGGKVRATNSVDSAFRISLTYTEGNKVLSPAVYDAANLPPGFNQPTKSGSIWRITGRPTTTGVFSNVRVTGYERADKLGDHRATVVLTLTVVDAAPVITTPPTGLSVAEGSPATFSVTATGGSLTYQWLKDDLEVPQATASTLTLGAVSPNDAGSYRVRIQNGGGLVISDPAILTVTAPLNPPVFTSTPTDAALHQGEPFTLTSSATGVGTLTFAWSRNGQPLQGATAPSLTLAEANSETAGSYTVSVTGTGGTASSPPATVTVFPPLAIGALSLGSGGLTVPFNGIAGRAYLLESAPGIASPVWGTLQETVAEPESAFHVLSLEAELGIFRIRTK